MAVSNTYIDIDLYGRENSSGTPIEHFDEKAIQNALILFLTAKKGDFLYNPELGGYMDYTLFKNLKSASLDRISFAFRNAITKYFAPVIELRGIQINPIYEDHTLEFILSYVNPATKTTEQLSIYTKNLSDIQPTGIEEVIYVGENLYMFCLMKKPDMGNNVLVYNENLASWCWGNSYKFTNLTTADSFFTTISSVCNG